MAPAASGRAAISVEQEGDRAMESAAAMRSGWARAIRFGTNSPRISEKYEMPITTTAMLMTWA